MIYDIWNADIGWQKSHISNILLYCLQALIIREKLAELYESEQEWSKAAQMLSGIDLDSGMR